MSIMISLPSGGRTLETARVTSDTNEYFLTGRRNPSGGATIPLGDRGRRPTPLGLEIEVQEASLAASLVLADDIADDFLVASSITTPRGTRSITGILSTSLRAEGPRVLLRYSLATSGGYP